MGHIVTAHVIGQIIKVDEDGNETIEVSYPCMNKVEMAQAMARSIKEGAPITMWVAQTQKGIGFIGYAEYKPASQVKLPKLVDCPICEKKGCIVCNYSGITEDKYWEKWLPWQLDNIRAEAKKS